MKVKDILIETPFSYNKKQGRVTVGARYDENGKYTGSSPGSRTVVGPIDVMPIVKDMPEWKRMNELMKFVSTDRELKNGTLHFAARNHSGVHVFVYSSGQLRRVNHVGNYDPSDNRYFQIPSPEPSDDVRERYQNALAALVKYVEKLNKKLQLDIPSSGDIYAARMNITDVRELNLPNRVKSSLNLADNKITGFEGFPKHIGGDLNLKGNPITSLSGMHRHITEIKGRLTIPQTVREGLLSALKINGITDLVVHTRMKDILHSKKEGPARLARAVDIVKKHLKDKDTLAAQEELIDAGLEEFATL
jgi:bifunctional DNA-binding transcriptional regulator/antitoxin component of YhaV-PrlF toxin-antitoxin module